MFHLEGLEECVPRLRDWRLNCFGKGEGEKLLVLESIDHAKLGSGNHLLLSIWCPILQFLKHGGYFSIERKHQDVVFGLIDERSVWVAYGLKDTADLSIRCCHKS